MKKIKIAKEFERNWIINRKKPLESKYRWGDEGDIISFIYSPETGEFGLSRGQRHKDMIQAYPNTPFEKFVRGIYIKSKRKIMLRAYSLDKIQNFNAQYDVVEALNLYDYKIKFNASSDELFTQYGWA